MFCTLFHRRKDKQVGGNFVAQQIVQPNAQHFPAKATAALDSSVVRSVKTHPLAQ